MDKIKEHKKKITLGIAGVLIACVALLGTVFRESTIQFATSQLSRVEVYASDLMDNHDYIEFPWYRFMTEEHEASLHEEVIEPLQRVELSERNEDATLQEVSGIVDEFEERIQDEDTYIEAIERSESLEGFTSRVLNNSSASDDVMELLTDIYDQEYTEINELTLVDYSREYDGDREWIELNLELSVLQDSEDFIIYPVSWELNERLDVIEFTWSEPFERDVTVRELSNEAYIEEDTHLSFVNAINDFESEFTHVENYENEEYSHLSSLNDNDVSIEVLRELFVDARGDFEYVSFYAYTLDDIEARAYSTYRALIPLDTEGNVSEYTFIFDRVYEEIIEIEKVD